MQLVTTWFGAFLLEGEEVLAAKLFPKEPEAIADRLARVQDWKLLQEESELLRGRDEVFVTEPRLTRFGGNLLQTAAPFLKPEDHGFDRDLLHRAMLALARRQMRKAVGPEDHLAQAVAALDDVTETSNLLTERLREWYGLHFPELARMVDASQFLDLVAEHGDRASMPGPPIQSVGADLSPEDREEVRHFASLARQVVSERRRLESRIEVQMKDLAPNVAHLAGPLIGARLVSLAGGVQELARLPSSTVQLLGAERALFRHLREGTRPPKHGVLFQHPFIHRAPRWQRGSLARAFAGKLSIAARADAYTRRFVADQLLEDLRKAMEESKRRHAKAPPRKRTPPGKRRKRRR